MIDVVKKADAQTFVDQYNNKIKNIPLITDTSKIYVPSEQRLQTPAPDINTDSLNSALIKKVSLESLQNAVNVFEDNFSGNCDCLHNYQCCQKECVGCETCQHCQPQCNGCQSQCNECGQCNECSDCACQSCQVDCVWSIGNFVQFFVPDYYVNCD